MQNSTHTKSKLNQALKNFFEKNKVENQSAIGLEIKNISTDSREIKAGDLYLPLIGEKFDGHDFIEEALEQGASLALSEKDFPENKKLVKVKNTLDAYHQIANEYRKLVNPVTIAITGSAGKTTTKELAAQALCHERKLHFTKANFNNEIGVPKTILSMPEDCSILVLEMGMRGLVQIETLTKIAEPNFAIITNIGTAHIEILGSKEKIREAKLEIAKGLKAHPDFKESPRLLVDSDLYQVLKSQPEITDFEFSKIQEFTSTDNIEMTMTLKSEGLAKDTAAIQDLCKLLSQESATVNQNLSKYTPGKGRGEFLSYKNHIIIDETYNANPEAVKNSLAAMIKQFPERQKLAVIGEIGESQPVLIGALFEELANQPLVQLVDARDKTIDDLKNQIDLFLDKDSVILIKASRIAKLEELIEELLNS